MGKEVVAEVDVDGREVWLEMVERNSFLQQCKWSMLAATDGVTRVLGSPLSERKEETDVYDCWIRVSIYDEQHNH